MRKHKSSRLAALGTVFMALLAIPALTGCGTKSADSKAETNDSLTNAENVNKAMAETGYNPNDTNNVEVNVKTTAGDFTVLLYGDTPRHRNNFVKLVNEGYYNGTLFHRVINEFMVQAGDPDSKTAKPGQRLGEGGPDYTIPAEIVYPRHFHKRGALAAARTGDEVNPMKESSGSQFYIVTGKKLTDPELAQLDEYMLQSAQQNYFAKLVEQNRNRITQMQQKGDQAGLQNLQNEFIKQTESYFAQHPVKVPANIKTVYKEIGGTPHLDNNYTVFGEVIKGMETIAKIEKAQTDNADRPKEDIKIISMSIVKK